MNLLSYLRMGHAQRLLRKLRWAGAMGAAALMVACGSGGGAIDPDAPAPGAPATPAGLSLGAPKIKALNFQWAAVDGATHYKLFEDLDGAGTASAPIEVGGVIYNRSGQVISSTPLTATDYAHEVPLFERLNATYTLKACNAAGCSASSPAFAPSVADLNAAIGHAKAAGGGVAGDFYGVALALSKDGQTLAVGAQFESTAASESGAVYVMRRTAAGVWSSPVMIKDYVGIQVDEYFGSALALSADGSVLAVGIPRNVSGAQRPGAVQLFVRNAAQAYVGTAFVMATNLDDSDGFGQSLALSDDGNVLAVGAPNEDSALAGDGSILPNDDSAAGSGAVYVYRRAGGVGDWASEQIIKAVNAEAGDQFGTSVALSGDGLTLAVGAAFEGSSADGVFTSVGVTDNNALESGAVYVFSRLAVEADFGNQVYIKASNSGASDRFGTAVALSQDGSVLAVGAYLEASAASGVGGNQDDDTATYAGAVYVFVRNDAGVWSQQAYLKASNTSGNTYFGRAVALSSEGNALAVGASNEARTGLGLAANPMASPGTEDRGAAFVFRRSAAGVWAQSAYIKSPTDPNGADHYFGYALALSGDGNTLAVGSQGESNSQGPAATNPAAGAPAEDGNTANNSGTVYLF